MPRLVYACRFEVPTEAGLDAVADAYQDWLVRHYSERRRIAEFAFDPKQTSQALGLPEQHNLASTVYKSGAATAVRIRWSYPDENESGLRWSNEVRIGQFGNRCSIEHVILIESVDYTLHLQNCFLARRASFEIFVRKLMRTLATCKCVQLHICCESGA